MIKQTMNFILHAVLHAIFAFIMPSRKLRIISNQKELRKMEQAEVQPRKNPNFLCVFSKTGYEAVTGSKSALEAGLQDP